MVFKCEISPKKDGGIFDADSNAVKMTVIDVARRLRISMHKAKTEEISRIYNVIIEEYEKEAGVLVEVLKGRTTPPCMNCFTNSKKYPIPLLGEPEIFVVRDISVIQILDHKGFTL